MFCVIIIIIIITIIIVLKQKVKIILEWRDTAAYADQPSLPRLYSATGTALRRS